VRMLAPGAVFDEAPPAALGRVPAVGEHARALRAEFAEIPARQARAAE